MGLRGPKSLIEAKDGHTFLDIIARQARALGRPLVLMNSFATREVRPADAEAFLQHHQPKLRADDLDAGALAARPDARVVPARPRRPLRRADRLRDARRAARARPPLRVRLQRRQPRRGARPGDPRLVRRRAARVRDGGRARAPRPTARAGTSRPRDGRLVLRETAQAPDASSFRDYRALAVLQHEQPVDRPGGAAHRGRARPAADRQPQDGRPERPASRRRCSSSRRRWAPPSARSNARRRARAALALRAGEDHQRPARPALGRVRAR